MKFEIWNNNESPYSKNNSYDRGRDSNNKDKYYRSNRCESSVNRDYNRGNRESQSFKVI